MKLQKESTHSPVKYDLTLPYECSYSSAICHSEDSITTSIHHQEHHRHSVGGTQYPGNSQPPLPEVTPPTPCKLSTGSSLRNNRLMKQALSGACLLEGEGGQDAIFQFVWEFICIVHAKLGIQGQPSANFY